MEMSILRQSEQSSNSSQEIPQSVRRGFRGEPDHIVFHLSRDNTFRFSVEFSLDSSTSYPLSRAYTRLCLQLVVFAKGRSECNFYWANRIVCTDRRIADSNYLA